MKITTDQPFFSDRNKITATIGNFWNTISEAWARIWGLHIHHGYYDEENLSPQAAQERLIEKLMALLEIPPQANCLDVGCGMGGSSFYFAKHYDATVTGVTLSQKQVAIATRLAQEQGFEKVTFRVDDALTLASIKDDSMDVVWALESCEQFYDKQLFLEQAYRVLKSGGQIMLATWCSDCYEYEGRAAKDYKKLCLAFDLPYMPTREYYTRLFKQCRFALEQSLDWSSLVSRSWDVGISLVNTYSFLQIIRLGGWRGFRFSKQIQLMRNAFNNHRVQYGVFIARKA